jgi:hypothetical protein
VNDELFAVSPLTTMEKTPDDDPEGTRTVITVSAQFVTMAFVPFSEIVLVP